MPARPSGLPEWIDYHQRPDDELHLRINNEAAIYIGTSRTEGWGLTVGEAMMCGQAVCCTDNAGFREMATDG
ncbi:MAG: glycosyltransferase, partial [Bacteroidales bacterium]|nr:glycosyltransferase [Bacteroidales bacterium]